MNDIIWLREAAAFALDATPRFVGIAPVEAGPPAAPSGYERIAIAMGDRFAIFEAHQP